MRRAAVEQHLRAMAMGQPQHRAREFLAARQALVPAPGSASGRRPAARGCCASIGSRPRFCASVIAYSCGSASAASTGAFAGSIGSASGVAEALPGDRLLLARLRVALPGGDAEEIEPHGGVRIGVHAGDPGIRRAGVDAEFLVQLARQGAVGRLARFDLAARELPVAGVDLAGRPPREQEGAVGALDHRRGDLDTAIYFFFACLPAQSRANW